MRINVTLLTSMASLLIGSACAYREAPRLSDGAPQDPGRATTTSPEVLPGRVVDVNAGEFFFQAPLSIPAGLTTFRLHQVGIIGERLRAGGHGQSGQSLVRHEGDNTYGFHQLWIVRLEDGKTYTDLMEAFRARAPRPWAKNLGGPGLSFPPRTTNATLDLEPGRYALACPVGSAREDQTRSHILKGMVRPFTVVPAAGPKANAPRPDLVIRMMKDGTADLSAPIKAGRQIINVENTTTELHEVSFWRVPEGHVATDDRLPLRDAGDFIAWGGLSTAPGTSLMMTIEFEPGTYEAIIAGNRQIITVR
jgi:hypothetical protein